MLRQASGHRLHVERRATHLRAILDEILRHLVAKRAEHEIDRVLKEHLVGPHRHRPRQAGMARRKEARLGISRLERARDHLRVAEDVGADLHHRRAAIAAGQRDQVRLRQDARDQHRAPGDALEAENEADLLGKRRSFEVMQDRLVGHGCSLTPCGSASAPRSGACCACRRRRWPRAPRRPRRRCRQNRCRSHGRRTPGSRPWPVCAPD